MLRLIELSGMVSTFSEVPFRVDGKKGAVSEELSTSIFRLECRMVEISARNRLPPFAVKGVADASAFVFEVVYSSFVGTCCIILQGKSNRERNVDTFSLNYATTRRGCPVFQDTVVLSLLLS
jgi:hypothetical protein